MTVQDVLALHRTSDDHPANKDPYCIGCWEAGGMDGAPSWPCPTVLALAEPGDRPGWDDYFLGIARAVATRGECRRSRVGAVLVRDRRIVATGYNGVGASELSCLDGICPREQMGASRGTPYSEAPCIATHAETNAAYDAQARGLAVRGSTMYLTKEPCEVCGSLLQGWDLDVVWEDLTTGRSGAVRRGRPVH